MIDTLPQLELPWTQSASSRHKSSKRSRRQPAHASSNEVRYAAYGAGMLTGAVLLRYMRNKLSRLPFLGLLAAPLLAFVPCTLLGAAAGAAVVYSIEERDIGAVRKKLLPKLTRRVSEARGEVAAVAADVRREAQRAHRHHERALRQLQREGERLAPALEGAAAEAERALAPIVRREYERGRREVQRSLRELEEAAAAVGDDGGRRGGRGGRWEQGAQSDRALVRRFAARSDTEDSG